MLFSAKVAAIEFAGDDVRIAVVKTTLTGFRVLGLSRARAEYETPEGRRDALIVAIKAALGEMRGRPSVYVLCVSGSDCIARGLTIPFRGSRRVAGAVPFELEPHLAFPIEEVALDYSVVAEISGETEVVAVGMRRDRLDDQLDILMAAGFDADAVTVDSSALTGLWQTLSKKRTKGLQAVLHVRETGSSLTVSYNRRIAFMRSLSCTAEQLLEQPQVVARDVANTLRAFLAKWRGEGEIATLQVTGVSLGQDEQDAISSALGLEVEAINLVERLACKRGVPTPGPNEWEATVGAALGAAGKAPLLDLRRSENGWNGAASGLTGQLLVSSCMALLVLMGWAFYYHQGTARNMQEAARIQAEIEGVNKKAEELKSQGLGDPTINTKAFQTPTVLAILQELIQKMPQGQAAISTVAIHSPEGRGAWIDITGKASDASAFNAVMENLKATNLFRIDENPDLSSKDGTTLFTIKAFRADAPTEEKKEKTNES